MILIFPVTPGKYANVEIKGYSLCRIIKIVFKKSILLYGNPRQYSCLENPREQRSLAGYSPWGSKESDTTGHRSTCTFYYNYMELPLLGPV